MNILGEILWEMGRAEASALSVLTLIHDDRHLAAAERRFLASRMIPEERAHAAQTRGWAARWARAPRAPRDAFGALIAMDTLIAAQLAPASRFAWTLAVTHWNEQNTLKAYDRYLPLFGRVSAGLAQDFTQIRDEEAEHVVFGRAVLRRLEREDPVSARRVAVLYPLVKRVYGTVVHAAHTKPLAALEIALGVAPGRRLCAGPDCGEPIAARILRQDPAAQLCGICRIALARTAP